MARIAVRTFQVDPAASITTPSRRGSTRSTRWWRRIRAPSDSARSAAATTACSLRRNPASGSK
ncbi:hypothetical protein LUX57_37525 [Actinomadura madurae]|nr:hypothetical protein [Actinomadura madurae]MCP9970185.1 hypothetical protein [Actinomadura madurae]